MTAFENLVAASFNRPEILVIGDLILDHYVRGTVKRISPEAPIPVLTPEDRYSTPGGAANVACNLAALGVRCRLVGAVGRDPHGDELLALLQAQGVDTSGVIQADGYTTTVKTRLIGDTQHIVRIDDEMFLRYTPDLRATMEQSIWTALSSVQAAILSDYGKGVIDEPLSQFAIQAAGEKTLIADPKGASFDRYRGAAGLVPNLAEFCRVAGVDEPDDETLRRAGQRLRRRLNLDFLTVTLGKGGMLVLNETTAHHIHAVAREVFDVSGAGDTVVAVLAAGLAAGLDLKSAHELANTAAGIVVGYPGTTPIQREQLLVHFQGQKPPPPEPASPSIERPTTPAPQRRSAKPMIIVTGGAGLIGSRIVSALNQQSMTDILVVDNLSNAEKLANMRDARIADYLDKDEFLKYLQGGMPGVEAIFHQGACTDTMETDGRYVMANNYRYSVELLRFAITNRVPLIYASSASVYGSGPNFTEGEDDHNALNLYAYSKQLFDDFVLGALPQAQNTVVGLRYFNVYGPGEAHKGRMASVIWQFYRQLQERGTIHLFEGSDGYGDGEQERDFVYVDDVVAANLFFWQEKPDMRGIFNVGTGQSRTFNDVARALIRNHGSGSIKYVPMPESIRDKYQSFTQADLTALRAAGYDKPFTSLEDGIKDYLFR